MTGRFEVGEVVDIVIKGARVFDGPDQEDEPGEGYDTFEVLDRDRRELVSLNLSYPQITVTRRAPKEWPPVAGDIWADASDGEWAAVNRDGEPWRVELMLTDNDDSGYCSPSFVAEQYGPMRLMYRRGWAPTRTMVATVTVDEPEPAEVDERTATIATLRTVADMLERNPDLPHEIVELNWPVRDVAAFRAWAAAFDAEVRSTPFAPGKTQHVMSPAVVPGFEVFAYCIEDTPEPAPEPTPAPEVECSFEWPEPDASDEPPHVCLFRHGHDGSHERHCGADKARDDAS